MNLHMYIGIGIYVLHNDANIEHMKNCAAAVFSRSFHFFISSNNNFSEIL